MMFEQLREELRIIKDRKFHRVPDSDNFPSWETPVEWPAPPPPGYQSFMEEFGPASLYRELSYWRIYVYAQPVEENDAKKGEFLRFGGTDSEMACFRRADVGCRIVPVYATQGVSGLFLAAE